MPEAIPETFTGGRTVLSPQSLGVLCAPCAMATVNFMGARVAALTILVIPLLAWAPGIGRWRLDAARVGELGPCTATLRFPELLSTTWSTACLGASSDPICAMPLKVS